MLLQKEGKRELKIWQGDKIIMAKKSIAEIMAENKRLRSKIESKREILAVRQEKNKLLREQKAILRDLKYGRAMKFGKEVGKTSLGMGKRIGKGLFEIAKRIDAAERREEMMKNKSRRKPRATPKRKKSAKRKTTQRR